MKKLKTTVRLIIYVDSNVYFHATILFYFMTKYKLNRSQIKSNLALFF